VARFLPDANAAVSVMLSRPWRRSSNRLRSPSDEDIEKVAASLGATVIPRPDNLLNLGLIIDLRITFLKDHVSSSASFITLWTLWSAVVNSHTRLVVLLHPSSAARPAD
jgi:hypothetical protein